jgi:hypothetical protein
VEYIALGRLLALSPGAGPKSRFARSVVRAFSASDVFCLLPQASGGGMSGAGNPSLLGISTKLMLARLALQLGVFTLFTALTVYVHAAPGFGFAGARHWRGLFGCMYATIALMFVRNIFRVVEYTQGYRGYLATHERFFYGFDFAPLILCFILFAGLNYGFWLGPSAHQRVPLFPIVPTHGAGAVSASPGAGSSAAANPPTGLKLITTPMTLYAARRAAGRHCKCCDAVRRAEASAVQGGGACCLACGCDYTVLQSVAH